MKRYGTVQTQVYTTKLLLSSSLRKAFAFEMRVKWSQLVRVFHVVSNFFESCSSVHYNLLVKR